MPKFVKIRDTGSERVFVIRDGVIRNRYLIVNPDGSNLLEEPEVTVSTLGRGGFGLVVRAVDELGIPRTVKLIDDLQTEEITPSGLHLDTPATSLFEQEIRLTNAQPFKNVVPVLDYGTGEDAGGKKFGFFVSHFIDGKTLKDFMEGLEPYYDQILSREQYRNRIHDQVLLLIHDVLAALVELDRANVVHMDLKPTNILVYPKTDDPSDIFTQSRDFAEAFVIDLGAGKPIFHGMRGGTGLRRTRFWFPEHLLSALGHNKVSGRIQREKLFEMWRAIDIHCCGLVLEWMLLNMLRRERAGISFDAGLQRQEQVKERFWKQVFGDDFSVIEGIISGMLAKPLPTFSTASDVQRAFGAIPLKTSSAILTSETLTDNHPGIRIRAGKVLVRVSLPFDQVVNHPAFQRLRLLQQLSFVNEIFPDGTHNRFSHSLRTFHLTKQFLWGLNRKSSFRLLFKREDVEQLLAAALLHDMGQYPFSHTIEDLRKMGDICGDESLSQVKHDQECVLGVLRGEFDPGGFESSVGALLEDHGISVENISYIVSKTEKDPKKGFMLNISRDLISGLLDADRVSYLLQDSERTGVPYGGAIDIGSLIEAFTIRWDPRSTKQDEVGLAIEEAGVSVAEAVLTAVYWMYRNVYWRHSNRAFMAAVKYVMRHLLKSKKLSFDQYWSYTYGKSDLDALRYLRTQFDEYMEGVPDRTNPLADIVDLKRLGYRRVFGLRFDQSVNSDLYDELVHGISPEREDKLIDHIAGQLPPSFTSKRGDILVDIPLKRRLHGIGARGIEPPITKGEKGAKAKVWVCLRNPLTKQIVGWKDLLEYSPLAANLADIEDHSGRKVRVFFSRSLLNQAPEDWSYIEDNMLEWVKTGVATW